MKTKILAGMLIVMSSFFFAGCEKEEMGGSAGSVAVRMMDHSSPQRYIQEMKLDIRQVRVHVKNGAWIDLPTKAGVYDLARLRNGVDVILVDPALMNPGQIDAVSLTLGDDHTVKIEDRVLPLRYEGERAIIIPVENDIIIPGNSTHVIRLHFDADKSVVRRSATLVYLHPVISVMP